MFLKHLIRRVKIIHVHADDRYIPRKLDVRRRDVQIEAVRVLHSDAFDVQLADSLRVMVFLKAKRLKQLNDRFRVLGDDLRIKGCDLHGYFLLNHFS